MKRLLYTPILATALGAVLSSCSTDKAAPTTEGWLSATIQADTRSTYHGTGYFQSTGELPGMPSQAPSFFYIYSSGTGESAGEEFVLTGYRGERPEVGRYPLGRSQGASYDWNLHYAVERGDSVALFGVVDGEFEITSSTEDAIAGHFTFTAVSGPVCSKESGTPVRDENGIPRAPCTFHEDPELPNMTIEGSFNVIHGLPCEPAHAAGDALTGAPRPIVVFCVE